MTHTTTGSNATIVSIAETMQITDKFKKKEFVVKMGDTYPQFVKFELTQSNTDQLDFLSEGDVIDVEFQLRGRQMPDGRVFNSLMATKVTKK